MNAETYLVVFRPKDDFPPEVYLGGTWERCLAIIKLKAKRVLSEDEVTILEEDAFLEQPDGSTWYITLPKKA